MESTTADHGQLASWPVGQLATAGARSLHVPAAAMRRATSSSQRKRRRTTPTTPGSRDGECCLVHSMLAAGLPFQKDSRVKCQRVLKGLDNICRLTFMAIQPDSQRQGIGYIMLKEISDETERCLGRCAYMLAAPEGVPLYSKFGFKVVGQVETPHGNVITMFRPACQ